MMYFTYKKYIIRAIHAIARIQLELRDPSVDLGYFEKTV